VPSGCVMYVLLFARMPPVVWCMKYYELFHVTLPTGLCAGLAVLAAGLHAGESLPRCWVPYVHYRFGHTNHPPGHIS